MRTPEGFDALREAGYSFSPFDSPRQFKKQADILSAAVEAASGLTDEAEIIRDTVYLVLDGLVAAPQGMEFFQRFPHEEVVQFCRLAVTSRVNQLPIPVACPVCPDYDQSGYKLNSGIGLAMSRVLKQKDNLLDFFSRRNFTVSVDVQVADVEMLEPLILTASGETQSSFLIKTTQTIKAIETMVQQLGLSEIIKVRSMAAAFAEAGQFYPDLKNMNKEEILNVLAMNGRKIRRAIEALVAERVRLGDYDSIDPELHCEMAAEELADYATFGDFVAGQAVILSPDALSAMPAYNFLRGREKLINPTIYLKPVKQKKLDIFMT